MSVKISDFPPCEQSLLRAAFNALVPYVVVGRVEGDPHVVSLGHSNGLVAPSDGSDGLRLYPMVRIRGVDKSPEELRIEGERKASGSR